jgi:hypothetical protein
MRLHAKQVRIKRITKQPRKWRSSGVRSSKRLRSAEQRREADLRAERRASDVK